MTLQESVGWLSALILIATLWRQVVQQWQSPSAEGVSRWLFLGQVSANAGFIVYSVMLDSVVFIVVNSVLLCVSIVGLVSLQLKRRQESGKAS